MDNGLEQGGATGSMQDSLPMKRDQPMGGKAKVTPNAQALAGSESIRIWFCLPLMVTLATGCAGLHPLEGIPASCLPPEYNQAFRSHQQTIDLSLLRQNPPKEYILDGGDVLGVYVHGVLGGRERLEAPPIHYQQNEMNRSSLGFPIHVRDDGTISLPGVSPISVRGKTVAQAEEQIRHAYTEQSDIIKPGREQILVNLHQPRKYRVLVLRQEMRGDRYNSNTSITSPAPESTGYRGRHLELPAYRNDVLNALAETGGLPRLDAENAVYIIRRNDPLIPDAPAMLQPPWTRHSTLLPPQNATGNTMPIRAHAEQRPSSSPLQNVAQVDRQLGPGDAWWAASDDSLRNRVGSFWHRMNSKFQLPPLEPEQQHPWWEVHPPIDSFAQGDENAQHGIRSASSEESEHSDPWWINCNAQDAPPDAPGIDLEDTHVTRIPIRLLPGEMLNFAPEDSILQDGDVVFIESREKEFFYTGGLLGGGQYNLPRDYDLDLLGALAMVQSQVNTQHNGASRAIGGNSSLNRDVTVGASKVIIRRQTPDNHTLNVLVDLKELAKSPCDNIYVQPGDHIILQYTKCEAMAAFFERHFLEPLMIGAGSGAVFNN